MFNGKALLLLAVAILFGTGASVFANNWLKQQAGLVAENNTVATTPVVVASTEIQYAQSIEPIHLKIIQWPSDSVPESSIQDIEEVVGNVANQKILSGEPILSERIVESVAGSTLSSLIAPNKRAITLRVNDVVGVAGFLLPGNHVDVLGTRMVDKRAISRTVLQNLKVLAVDQTANSDKDEPVVVRAVTLEANLRESLDLVQATEEGSIQLVLRNPEDLATYIEPPTTVAQAAPAKKPVRRSTPAAASVRIIRGTSVNSTSVRN